MKSWAGIEEGKAGGRPSHRAPAIPASDPGTTRFVPEPGEVQPGPDPDQICKAWFVLCVAIRKEYLLCDAECESVSHVLWDSPAYASIRSAFMLELRRELGEV